MRGSGQGRLDPGKGRHTFCRVTTTPLKGITMVSPVLPVFSLHRELIIFLEPIIPSEPIIPLVLGYVLMRMVRVCIGIVNDFERPIYLDVHI